MNANANPKQIKLIGVLVVVLIGVVALRMRPKSKPRPVQQPQQTADARSSGVLQSKATSEDAAADERPLTASARLADLWKSNPFRGMSDAVEPEPVAAVSQPVRRNAASVQLLEELTGKTFDDDIEETTLTQRAATHAELRVSAILDDGQERRALVGNAIAGVGDELDGFEVVAIHSNGIELADTGKPGQRAADPAESE